MPPSFHLKFELYPTPDPASGGPSEDVIWLPLPGATIFDDLPSHPRKQPLPARRRNEPRYNGSSSSSTVDSFHAGDDSGKDHRESSSSPSPPVGVIDCGAPRATTREADPNRNVVVLSERQWRARSKSFPPPGFSSGIGPRTATKDWRFGRISIESFDLVGDGRGSSGGDAKEKREHDNSSGKKKMAGTASGSTNVAAPAASLGPNLGGAGQATKARYVPLETKNTEVGWGIVHLYREGDESHRTLDAVPEVPDSVSRREGVTDRGGGHASGSADDDEGTILCIPAVPSYLSPSDFLGFVGEKWRGDVSHYRMVMTSRMNRYMVLMKFRDNRRAREWRKEFDGKAFNSMEAEICHVTFIKSITVETPGQRKKIKAPENPGSTFGSSSSGVISSLKPFPPPTPDLIELPTCPVCLERMDDTTGLMTILCQHVFHCTCLQTWKGSGCPVCRATNPSPDQDLYGPDNPYTKPFGSGVSNLCSVCDTNSDLWICLICGNVGCGRYKGGHAKDHWKETAHSFSLELETQHVWDYAGDMWVHRLIRDKGDGKVVELPSNNGVSGRQLSRGSGDSEGTAAAAADEDVVPRAKLDRIGMEYTHLLTNQLESQRVYFEEMVSKAADKAAKAAASAEAASAHAQKAVAELADVQAEQQRLRDEIVPQLERDLARERGRAARAQELARDLARQLQEEKRVGEGLLARVEHIGRELDGARARETELRAEIAELRDMNRDLSMFISGQEKLRELEDEGKVGQGELEDGTVSVPVDDKKRAGNSGGSGKGKGKAKK